MKKITLTLFVICCLSQLLRAQSFEFSVGANTGWFAYNGPGATSGTAMFVGTSPSNSDVLNSYGSKYAFSYGAFLQPQYVFKSGFIIGMQGSYDIYAARMR